MILFPYSLKAVFVILRNCAQNGIAYSRKQKYLAQIFSCMCAEVMKYGSFVIESISQHESIVEIILSGKGCKVVRKISRVIVKKSQTGHCQPGLL